MTFIEILNIFNNKYGKENQNIFIEIFSFISKKYKTKNDILLSLKKEIDFSYKKASKLLYKYFNKKIPLEYITKKTNFMGLDFYINKNVLIPRKETEYLVHLIINDYSSCDSLNIVDLCSGSGSIGLSIKKYLPNSNVTLIEKYSKPIRVSKINAKKLNVDARIIKDDICFTNIYKEKYNLIISNPPYVSDNYVLNEYTAKEPKVALFANDNGLEIIKIIISKYYESLIKNGCMYIEFGYDQKNDLEKFISGKYKYEFIKDQFFHDRFLKIIKE